MTTLAEDLVILAVGLKPKLGPGTGALPLTMRAAIRGAELVTLTMAGRVAVQGGQVVILDALPISDPALDERLSTVVRSGGVAVNEWMSDFPMGFVTAYFERLHAAGALVAEQVRPLGVFKRTGYRVADQAYYQTIVMRLHAAATSTGQLDAAQEALAGLVYVAGLSKWAYPGTQNAAIRARLAELVGVDPVTGRPKSTGSRQAMPSNDDLNRLFPMQDPAAHAAHASTPAAIQAAAHAAVQGAVHAAVNASVHAASQSATHAHHSSGSSSSSSSESHHHH